MLKLKVDEVASVCRVEDLPVEAGTLAEILN